MSQHDEPQHDEPRTLSDPLPEGETPPEVRTFADPPPDAEVPEEFRAFDDAPTEWADWPDEVVEAVRAAESAQQRSVCNIPPGDLPEALRQALDLRVEVNLAQYDGGPVVRVGGRDPQVRELEAPYSKRRPAED